MSDNGEWIKYEDVKHLLGNGQRSVKMNKETFRTKRTEIISEMLDNPENGIYPTTVAFNKLDLLFDAIVTCIGQGEQQPIIDMHLGMIWKVLSFVYDIIRKLTWDDYDINEDFTCGNCGKPVFKRVLYCSEKCEFEFEGGK